VAKVSTLAAFDYLGTNGIGQVNMGGGGGDFGGGGSWPELGGRTSAGPTGSIGYGYGNDIGNGSNPGSIWGTGGFLGIDNF